MNACSASKKLGGSSKFQLCLECLSRGIGMCIISQEARGFDYITLYKYAHNYFRFLTLIAMIGDDLMKNVLAQCCILFFVTWKSCTVWFWFYFRYGYSIFDWKIYNLFIRHVFGHRLIRHVLVESTEPTNLGVDLYPESPHRLHGRKESQLETSWTMNIIHREYLSSFHSRYIW